MKYLHIVTFTLVLVGALNWGLIGLTNGAFNPVAQFLDPNFANLVYIAIGASAVVVAATHMKDCRVCGTKGKK